MLRRIVRFALRQRLLVIGATLLLVVLGVRAFDDLPVEAFPDVEDVHVQVISLWSGHAAEEIERSVTLPIERQMNGLPALTNLRSISMFGLSVVTMTFEDGTTDYFARQQVLERLGAVVVPNGVQPSLASLSNSTGEIYRYTLRGALPLTDMKSLEDWVIEPAFRTVPGVADVVSFGGRVKQYQIDLDPQKLQAYGVTLSQAEQAVAASNANAGGGYITHGYERQVVRGEGLFTNVDDIARVAIATHNGIPVRVRDVGTVVIGGAPREGSSLRTPPTMSSRASSSCAKARTPSRCSPAYAPKPRRSTPLGSPRARSSSPSTIAPISCTTPCAPWKRTSPSAPPSSSSSSSSFWAIGEAP